MKKLVFMFAAFVALSFVSCNEAGKGGVDSDSINAAVAAADSAAQADSIAAAAAAAADTIPADSTAA